LSLSGYNEEKNGKIKLYNVGREMDVELQILKYLPRDVHPTVAIPRSLLCRV